MRVFFNGLLLGIILGAVGVWFVQKKGREHPQLQERYKEAADQAGASASIAARHFSEALEAKLETLDLRSAQIKDELARTGQIVRRKASDLGAQVSDAAADARIVVAIKAKYAAEKDLSVWHISVSSDHGHVTLSGSVSNERDIGLAVALALDTEGVREATSTLKVSPER